MKQFLFFGFFLIIQGKCGLTEFTVDQQLPSWKAGHGSVETLAINPGGHVVPSLTASLTVGSRGPILFQDTNLFEQLAFFNRERIPERVVHAKAAGALGYFEVTHDISAYTKAKVFDRIGKVTGVIARLSTVGGETGSADTVRDPRGFAVKFYTEDGNWDLVGNNIVNFPIRDPILFSSLNRSRKRNPATHMADINSFWDFTTLRSESTLHTMILFSDRGIPDGVRHMHGFGVHTFKMVNSLNEQFYVKFHWRSAQGIKNLSPEAAAKLAGTDPDYSIRDLYEAISNKNFPVWNLHIQVMTLEQAESYRWNPFDITKFWLYTDYPLIPVGRMVLNKNPVDYFTQIEQLTVTPGNLIPGIQTSPDRMLQGRLFAYPDSQRYRIGINYSQLPVNQPKFVIVGAYTKDGQMCFGANGAGAPNYYPNSFSGPIPDPRGNLTAIPVQGGDAIRADTGDEDNFSQATYYWNVALSADERQRLVNNIANDLSKVIESIRERAIENFNQVHPEFGRALAHAIKVKLGLIP